MRLKPKKNVMSLVSYGFAGYLVVVTRFSVMLLCFVDLVIVMCNVASIVGLKPTVQPTQTVCFLFMLFFFKQQLLWKWHLVLELNHQAP